MAPAEGSADTHVVIDGLEHMARADERLALISHHNPDR